MSSDLPLVFFTRDVAAVLRCDERTVQRLQRAGELPERLPIRGRPRWARGVILDWLATGQQRRRGRAR